MTRCGDMKITMGTGGFVDLNTGSTPFPSTTGLSQMPEKKSNSFKVPILSLVGNLKVVA